MGSAPFLGGGFGHFYAYAPSKIEYAIDRYAMEVKRQLDVLDRRLAESAVPRRRRLHASPTWRSGPGTARWSRASSTSAGEFLQVQEYTHVLRWTDADRAAPGRASAAAWSTAPGASRRASCTSATTPPTSTPAPRTSWLDDHPLRLRHRAEPAPRPHPARREGRGPRDGAGRPAQRRAAGRGLPQDQSAVHRAGAAHRRRPAADRQRRRSPRTWRRAIPSRRCSAARRRRRPRSRAGTGASSSRACCRSPRRCATARRRWPTARCPGRWTTRRSPSWRSAAWRGCSSSSSTLNERLADRDFIADRSLQHRRHHRRGRRSTSRAW